MLALVVTVPGADVELASDVLWSLGVGAIEECVVAGHVELRTSLGDDVDGATGAAAARLAPWPWRFVEVDEAVANTWRAHAQPVWIDTDLVVCPAWVPFEAGAGVAVLRIEPGSTFGLGDHPTTMLSMRAMRAALLDGATVLDVGCGSGVLAVGACVLGASRAEAIDIAPASVPITRANATANGVADRVHVSTTPLAEVDGRYDIVVANILAPTLIEMADDLRRVVAPSGVLIVSGVLAARHEHVEAALQPFRQTRRSTHDGWAAVTLAAP
ncbi:MAG: 50S ribosomal protein L11 methyltransferase [Actinomycetota bacterium]|nr:50S ribosomal protein L11 methyltransferase [Actinomycetota bacterium]